jgi:hypothetical protein
MTKFLEKMFESEKIEKDVRGYFIPICIEDLKAQEIGCGIYEYCIRTGCAHFRKVYLENGNKYKN